MLTRLQYKKEIKILKRCYTMLHKQIQFISGSTELAEDRMQGHRLIIVRCFIARCNAILMDDTQWTATGEFIPKLETET